uniref:Uncharacterized protein n=1 Tax=Noccaea caerulescens TaxID=107243 RepID=A0A1J3EBP9_NOCCA
MASLLVFNQALTSAPSSGTVHLRLASRLAPGELSSRRSTSSGAPAEPVWVQKTGVGGVLIWLNRSVKDLGILKGVLEAIS